MSAPTIASFLLFSFRLAAQEQLVSSGFDHFYNLEFDAAVADFSAAAQQDPNDGSAWNHLAQSILYRAAFRSGALETQLIGASNPFLHREKVSTTPAEDTAFSDAIRKSLELSQARLRANPNDTDALYTSGIAYGLRANYNFLVKKAWLDALRDASNAQKAHLRVCRLDSNYVDARLIPALYDYVTGSLSIGYRILGLLGGFRGDRQRGIATLETVARQGKSNRVDAQVLLAAVYRRERRSQEAIPLLESLIHEFPRSYLLRFEIVQLYNEVNNQPLARDQLDRIRELRRSGAQGFADLPLEKINRLDVALPKRNEMN